MRVRSALKSLPYSDLNVPEYMHDVTPIVKKVYTQVPRVGLAIIVIIITLSSPALLPIVITHFPSPSPFLLSNYYLPLTPALSPTLTLAQTPPSPVHFSKRGFEPSGVE